MPTYSTSGTWYADNTWSYSTENESGSENSSLYQGSWSGSSYVSTSFMNFQAVQDDILNTISGSSSWGINWANLRLTNLHSWYSSGMNVVLHTSNGSNMSGVYDNYPIAEGQTLAQTVSTSFAYDIAGGTNYWAALGAPSTDLYNLQYYGYFYGGGGSHSYEPCLVINYSWTIPETDVSLSGTLALVTPTAITGSVSYGDTIPGAAAAITATALAGTVKASCTVPGAVATATVVALPPAAIVAGITRGDTEGLSDTATVKRTAKPADAEALTDEVRLTRVASLPVSTEGITDTVSVGYVKSVPGATATVTAAGLTGVVVATETSNTPVGSMWTSWQVLNSVSSTAPMIEWDIGGRNSSSTSMSWKVRNPVSSTLASRFNSMARVSSSLSCVWQVRAAKSSTASITWRTITQVASTKSVQWNARVRAASRTAYAWNTTNHWQLPAKTLSWQVRNPVSSTASFGWNTLNRRPVPQNQIAWNLSQRTSNVIKIRWNTCEHVRSAQIFGWNIGIVRLASTASMKWNDHERVPTSRALAWNLRKRPASRALLTWNLLNRATTSKTLDWRVLQRKDSTTSLAWKLFTRLSSARLSAWRQDVRLSSGTTTAWTTWGRRSAAHSVAWRVSETGSPSTANFDWRVLQRKDLAATVDWKILQRKSSSRGLAWKTLKRPHSNAMLGWNTVGRTLSSLSTQWKVRQRKSSSTSIAWDFLLTSAVSSSQSILWDVYQRRTSGDPAFAWDVNARWATEVLLQWQTLNDVTSTATMEWNVGQPTQTGMRLLAADRWGSMR